MEPNVLHFKIFGSKCYPTVLNRPKGNHNPKALIGIFVGYQEQQLRGWKIYLPGSNEFIITAHVHFENDKFNKAAHDSPESSEEDIGHSISGSKRRRDIVSEKESEDADIRKASDNKKVSKSRRNDPENITRTRESREKAVDNPVPIPILL